MKPQKYEITETITRNHMKAETNEITRNMTSQRNTGNTNRNHKKFEIRKTPKAPNI